jgi:hypothetical protein
LVNDLTRHGIILAFDPNRPDVLRFHPKEGMTPELAERIKALKPALLNLLRTNNSPHPNTPPSNPTPLPIYSEKERRILKIATPALRIRVDAIKSEFTDTGGVTLLSVRPDPDWPRNQTARLIREARRSGRSGLCGDSTGRLE